jgi:hypothetical protein
VRELHQEFLRNISFEAAGYLNWTKVRHTLLRIRRETMPACPDLETFINYLETDDEIYNTFGKIRGKIFYLGTVQNDMMVFGNLRMVDELDPAFYLFVDATFGVTPFRAEQLLVVMAEIYQKPRPIAYALMTSKRHIRDAVLSYDGNLRQPVSVMADYEMRNALRKVWPKIDVNGCLFHYAKALRQKARKIKELATKIRRGTIHHQTLMLFSRLALLPFDRIDIGIAAIKKFISDRTLENDFSAFMEYFYRVWMGRYNKTDWCVSNCRRRTNNNVEGHNKLIKLTIPHNPSPWIFIDSLSDLVFDSLASVAADKENFTVIDRSAMSEHLTQNLVALKENRITEIEFLN